MHLIKSCWLERCLASLSDNSSFTHLKFSFLKFSRQKKRYQDICCLIHPLAQYVPSSWQFTNFATANTQLMEKLGKTPSMKQYFGKTTYF